MILVKIALGQMQLTKDINENLEKTLQMMKTAAQEQVELICFPELQLSPFFPQYEKLDVANYLLQIDDPMIGKISDMCKSINIVAVPNIYLNEGGSHYDASLIIDGNGKILGTSKMVHIAHGRCFYEQDYYHPSDTGFRVYDTAVGKIGVIVCFDRHLPESFRLCALQGAELVIIPTANTKEEPSDKFEWELRIAAMQNNLFIAMCNRVGQEDQMRFSGESIVVDPNGDVIVKANATEQIVYADLDLSMIQKCRQQRPYLQLRRPEVYSGICDMDTGKFHYLQADKK